MKQIPVEEAVGLVICHDITEIVKGQHKSVAFKRGHVVKKEDIEHLLRIGKEHLYVWTDQPDGQIHEDAAAERIARAICGPGVTFGSPKEGRINLTAVQVGLLKINLDLLAKVNSVADVTVATLHSLREVKIGQALAGTRVIPLCLPESNIIEVENLCRAQEPLIAVLPFKRSNFGIVTTGSEVFHGRIKDSFSPVLRAKISDWGSEVIEQITVPDETEKTVQAILEVIEKGAEIVAVTGGMSVDPDDKTPAAIRQVCDRLITYGAPVYPGAMFMLGYRGTVPVMGVPGCAMYHRASIFDLIVARILAGLGLEKQDFIKMAHGGLCEGCPECRFPNCSFGKF